MKVKAFNIVWDTDGENVIGLPNQCVIDLDYINEEEDINEELADALSDEYGWCVSSVNYKVIR